MRNDRTLSRAQATGKAFLTEVVVAGLNVPQINILKNWVSFYMCCTCKETKTNLLKPHNPSLIFP